MGGEFRRRKPRLPPGKFCPKLRQQSAYGGGNLPIERPASGVLPRGTILPGERREGHPALVTAVRVAVEGPESVDAAPAWRQHRSRRVAWPVFPPVFCDGGAPCRAKIQLFH